MHHTLFGNAHLLIMENCEGGEHKAFIKNSGGKMENIDVYSKYFTEIIEGLVEIHGRKKMLRVINTVNEFIYVVGKQRSITF